MHFNFLEDIETLLNPQKIVQIKEITMEIKRRLERDAEEADIKANPSSITTQFQKCVEANKAKLIACFQQNIIAKKNEEIKGELKSIIDKLNRKYQLIVETNGEDSKLIQDFLLAYVKGMSRFKELSDAIKNKTEMAGTELVAKRYLQGVEEIFQSVKRYTIAKLEEVSRSGKAADSFKKLESSTIKSLESKKESTSRLEVDSESSDEDDGCKISRFSSKSPTNIWREQSEKFRYSEKEPLLIKKIKYSEGQMVFKPSLLEETKMDLNGGVMDIEEKISGKLSSG